MNTTWARASVMATVAVFLLSALPALAGNGGPAPADDPGPTPTGSVPRTSLVEMFTNAGCYYCQFSDPPFVRLTDEFYDSPAVYLFWHVWWPGADPFYNAATTIVQERVGYYSINGAPTVIFDGGGAGNGNTLWHIGGDNMQVLYDDYKANFVGRTADTTSVSMTVTGDLGASSATITTSMTAVDPVTQGNLRLRILVYETQLYYPGDYGIDVHPYTVRAVVTNESLSLPWGIPVVRTHTFSVSPSWNANNLGVVAFIQTDDRVPVGATPYPPDYNAEVVQAADLRFVKPSVLIHRNEEVSPPDYQEYFEYEFSQTAFSYHMYNTLEPSDTGASDAKAMPTATDMEEYAAVVWSTGSDQTNSLDSNERAAVQAYLDNGPGSIYVVGENIGDELWPMGSSIQTWFRSYLHAEHMLDAYSATTMQGISLDPISGSWAGINLNLPTSSDDSRVGIPTGQTQTSATFTYPGGGAINAVKSIHDADSRVVYMANKYFEGTDANRPLVMDNILKWLDCAAPPVVSVTNPAGGEIVSPGQPITVTWTALDVLIPEDGVDIQYAEDSSNPVWQTVALNQPNDGTYSWTAPGLQSNRVRVRVTAADSCGTTADAAVESADFTIGTPYQLALGGPQRLISIRVDINNNAANVFFSCLGNVGTVRWYDPNDAQDHWKSWSPSRPGDLPNINNRMGMWVDVTSGCTLSIFGSEPVSTNIPLKAGWNLVGYPSQSTTYTVNMLKSATGATRVEGFDASAGPYYLKSLSNSATLQHGNGYWVYVPADTTWTVAG